MKATNKLRKRRAISPVIATVILVAVAITVAVGVSYWMSGIAGQYTSFEKVEIQSAYASRKYDGVAPAAIVFKGWVISIDLQNTGSSTSTLESIFVNEKPISEYGDYGAKEKIRWTDTAPTITTDEWTTDWEGVTDATSVSLESGDEATIYVLIYGFKASTPAPTDGLFSAGTTINIKIHSASGMDYIKLVKMN